MFGFQKLEVWKAAVELADHAYRITKRFPSDERFGLTSQLRRASVSVSANIAEGSGRRSPKDFGRFLEIAFGSLMEVISLLEIARRQEFLPNEEFEKISQSAERISKMLSGLRSSLDRKL